MSQNQTHRSSVAVPPKNQQQWIQSSRRKQTNAQLHPTAIQQNAIKTKLKRALPPSMAPTEIQAPSFEDAHKVQVHKNLQVAFPFKPYQCQIKYMSHLAAALISGSNALLESPTGTGKTMCLLSVVMAWQYAILNGTLPNPKIKSCSTNEQETASNRKNIATEDVVWENIQAISGVEGKADVSSMASADTSRDKNAVTASHYRTLDGGSGHERGGTDESKLKDKSVDGTRLAIDPRASLGNKKARAKIEQIPKVYYSSRTHSQLAQVVSELKKSPYYHLSRKKVVSKPQGEGDLEDVANDMDFTIRSVCLGSRDQYCIHPEATGNKNLRGTTLNSWCKKQTAKKICTWHSGCDATLKRGGLFSVDVFDIESLRQVAAKGHRTEAPRPFCPFYAAREVQKKCSLILLPYTYLVIPSMRKRLGLDINRDVIIIDEAHNLEANAEEATSFELTENDVNAVITAIEKAESVINLDKKDDGEKLRPHHVSQLEGLIPNLTALNDYLRSAALRPSPMNVEEKVHMMRLEDFHEVLKTIGLNAEVCSTARDLFELLASALESAAFEEGNELNSNSMLQLATWLEEVSHALGIIWLPAILASSKKFRLMISSVTNNVISHRTSLDGRNAQQPTEIRKLSFWSFAAHVALLDFFPKCNLDSKCHSLIITSGTLKPMNALALQLGSETVKFPIQLENTHVIDKEQLYAAVVSTSAKGIKLSMTFETLRNNPDLIDDVGRMLIDCCRALPRDGILVFFPSYGQMRRFTERWTQRGLTRELQGYKELFLEPSDAQLAAVMIEDFKTVIDREYGRVSSKRRRSIQNNLVKSGSSGAIFCGVCRGRVSEGLSMADDYCRLVLVLGVPFPSVADLRIATKRQVFNANPLMSGSTRVDGSTWYSRQASMAVNQAAGRIIRHRKDFGAVLFVDSRYSSKERLNDLSGWISENLYSRGSHKGLAWPTVKDDLTRFFAQMKGTKNDENANLTNAIFTPSEAAPSRPGKSRPAARKKTHIGSPRDTALKSSALRNSVTSEASATSSDRRQPTLSELFGRSASQVPAQGTESLSSSDPHYRQVVKQKAAETTTIMEGLRDRLKKRSATLNSEAPFEAGGSLKSGSNFNAGGLLKSESNFNAESSGITLGLTKSCSDLISDVGGNVRSNESRRPAARSRRFAMGGAQRTITGGGDCLTSTTTLLYEHQTAVLNDARRPAPVWLVSTTSSACIDDAKSPATAAFESQSTTGAKADFLGQSFDEESSSST